MSTNTTPLPFSPAKSDPSLKDLLDLLKKDILLSFFSHQIGTVQSFDESRQTASATINYTKTYFKINESTGNFDPYQENYPLLVDCPVIVLGGGDASLTFPIEQGDECLVLFNDRDIDNWFQGGAGSTVATTRLHSFSDGLILVGVRSLGNVLEDYDLTRAVLQKGTTMVGVGDTLIKIANATTTLNTLLQELITNIQSLVTQTAAITVTGVTIGSGVSGVPANAATITAINAQLTTTANEISGLLE